MLKKFVTSTVRAQLRCFLILIKFQILIQIEKVLGFGVILHSSFSSLLEASYVHSYRPSILNLAANFEIDLLTFNLESGCQKQRSCRTRQACKAGRSVRSRYICKMWHYVSTIVALLYVGTLQNCRHVVSHRTDVFRQYLAVYRALRDFIFSFLRRFLRFFLHYVLSFLCSFLDSFVAL